MSNSFEYVGKDLEAMDFAVNYHRWILKTIKPYLGKSLVEVGAGTGSFSEFLLETNPDSISLVEPSQMFQILESKKFKTNKQLPEINTYNSIFANVAQKIKDKQSPDSIIYINVFEHIEDDLNELKLVYKTLNKNGRVIIFVPALPILYSDFDEHIGHYRRYLKSDLIKKCKAANFKILLSTYFDFAGILPWFINFRLLKSLKMSSSSVHLYDKSIVPVTKFIEGIVPPPIGKNLLVIAEKND